MDRINRDGVYRIMRRIIAIALPLQLRLHVTGLEYLPEVGPALLVSNHLSAIDPLAVGVRCRRQLRILAKAEIFDWFVIGGLARVCGVVPIHRGEWDLAALTALRAALCQGHTALIFPEGTCPMPPLPAALLQFKTGAAWLAVQTHAPVVPVAIWGSEHVWTPRRGWRPWHRPVVHVRFGAAYYPQRPADLSSHAALQPVADEMARHVRALLPERYHGYYRTSTQAS